MSVNVLIFGVLLILNSHENDTFYLDRKTPMASYILLNTDVGYYYWSLWRMLGLLHVIHADAHISEGHSTFRY